MIIQSDAIAYIHSFLEKHPSFIGYLPNEKSLLLKQVQELIASGNVATFGVRDIEIWNTISTQTKDITATIANDKAYQISDINERIATATKHITQLNSINQEELINAEYAIEQMVETVNSSMLLLTTAQRKCNSLLGQTEALVSRTILISDLLEQLAIYASNASLFDDSTYDTIQNRKLHFKSLRDIILTSKLTLGNATTLIETYINTLNAHLHHNIPAIQTLINTKRSKSSKNQTLNKRQISKTKVLVYGLSLLSSIGVISYMENYTPGVQEAITTMISEKKPQLQGPIIGQRYGIRNHVGQPIFVVELTAIKTIDEFKYRGVVMYPTSHPRFGNILSFNDAGFTRVEDYCTKQPNSLICTNSVKQTWAISNVGVDFNKPLQLVNSEAFEKLYKKALAEKYNTWKRYYLNPEVDTTYVLVPK